MNLAERAKDYLTPLWRNLTSPAYAGSMALLGIGFWAAGKYGRGQWRALRFVLMGALGAGVGYGILVPLIPPMVSRRVLTVAAVASASSAPAPAPSRSAVNKSVEPAQGVEASGVFVGQ